MDIATLIKTGEQVEIVSVNGGWTTIHTLGADTREMKVRNSALGPATRVSGQTAELAMQKAEKARALKAEKVAKEPKAPREKMDPSERKNGRVDPLYLPQYTAYSATRKDGTKIRSMDKGDMVALSLRGKTLPEVYSHAAKELGLSVADLINRFSHLNAGMQRMSVGNMIRKLHKEASV